MIAILPLALVLLATSAGAADWNPRAWADVGTLQVRTAARGEGEHWSTLWLATVDGQLYVRLGKRATRRIEQNTTAPLVSVRVRRERFDRVRAVPAPEAAERVAAAMKAKYWSDVVVHLLPHPLTVRLVPEDTP